MDLGPFPKGINNREKDFDIPEGSIRNGVNIDLDNRGNASRRRGLVKRHSGLDIRGGIGTPAGAFFLQGQNLMRFEGNSASIVGTGWVGDHLAHLYLDEALYLSDGLRNACIRGGSLVDWGMPVPPAPLLSTYPGALGEGKYVVAVAWVDTAGRQSGLSTPVAISLSSGSQGIVIGNLPGPPSSMITQPQYLRIFASAANGDVLYRVADISLSATSYAITLPWYHSGFEQLWEPLGPPPAGRIIRSFGGRILIADDTGLVWYSKPMSPHLFDLANDYLMFSEPVTVMEPVESGIFFATDSRTEFHLGADIEEGLQVVERYNYGAPFGTGERITYDAGASVAWQSHRGVVVGGADGSLQNIQENAVPDVGTTAAGIVREQNGIRQFIASIKDGEPGSVAASSWITAEVIRRS